MKGNKIMPTKQQKAAAEPFLERAAAYLHAAKRTTRAPDGRQRVLYEASAANITKANQLLKGK